MHSPKNIGAQNNGAKRTGGVDAGIASHVSFPV
jgi:hypothetical protein